jgi:predicted MPP superfamily phosphohydrolase
VQEPEGAETNLVAGAKGIFHLFLEPGLELGHYNPSVVLPIITGVLAAGVAIVAYAVFLERRWYRLARYRLDILPADVTGGIDLLHLSDLHMLRGDRRLRRFLSSLPQADVTVITGDMVGDPESVEYVVESLRAVRGRRLSLFVLGSNDMYAPMPGNYLRYFVPARRRKRRVGRRGRAADLVRLLETDGWLHLRNRRDDWTLDGIRLEVVGLDDSHIHRSDPRVARRTTSEALGLAIIHSPDPAPELLSVGYDLVVAGHTHGGQVRLPFVGALVTNCSLPTRMASGLFRLGRGFLHVSPGLGTSKYAPFRLFCRPQAALIQLRPAAQREEASAVARSNTAS